MDSAYGVSRSGGEQSSDSQKRKMYHRHTPQQTQQLEEFFKDFPHPDQKQREKLSRDLGLEPQQIKFWFQNKRTQKKTMNERAGTSELRAENERLRRENMGMREALQNMSCLNNCQDQPQSLGALRMENLRLREEHERTSLLVGKSVAASPVGFCNFSNTSAYNYFPDRIDAGQIPRNSEIPSTEFQETDKSVIIETAISAMNELIDLLHMKDPVWVISPSDGKSVLHQESYEKFFPKSNHFKSANTRMESSKESGEVAMRGAQLVEVFLDPIKWIDMFPTIVTKARTFEVLDTATMFPNGSMCLMYEKMHVLSPFVVPREFFFVRFIQHIAATTWVIVDVSYDFIKHLQDATPTRSWKFPSGCMIEDKSNGKSFITWIEHVEVLDDKSLTHRLYRDLVGHAYGAKRWITTLQRMCDRFACSIGLATTPRHELEGVINSSQGRRNLMRLSHRMVKSLSQILSMSDSLHFPNLSEHNSSGVRITSRKNIGTGQPNGSIVAATISISLPFSIQHLFDFFNDETKRSLWDILSAGNPVCEIARISTGNDLGNCISIIQPFVPKENLLMLQESSIDSLGASIVYAPIDLPSITSVLNGEDTAKVQILPSGYLISSDGKMDKGINGSSTISGSILTIVFQILACYITKSEQTSMKSVATVHTFMSSTIQRIKAALGCPGLEY